MSGLIQDLRYALRTLAKQPAFTLAVLGLLALGIGTNAAIFGIFNGYFLRPLPFPDPDRLVRLDEAAPRWDLEYTGMAYPDFHHWRERNSTFEGMAVVDPTSFNLSGDGSAERVRGAEVSHDMAEVLGIHPLIGRDFAPADDEPGAPNIVLVTSGFWEEQWGGDPDVLGRTIRLNAEPYTVVGVLPPEATFVADARLWVPLRSELAETSGNYFLTGFGRLKEGVSREKALADLTRIHENLKDGGPASEDTHPVLDPALEREVGESRGPLLALLASVGLLLLIACANIAGLMLARGLSRTKEVSVRMAVGAGRGRIVRQLLTESLLLAGLGGLAGAVMGLWGSWAILATMPQELPTWMDFGIDYRFLLFVIVAVGASAVVSGLFPALRAARAGEGGLSPDAATRSTAGAGRSRALRTLVMGEVALAVVLLVVAALGAYDLRAVGKIDPGFDSEGILTYGISLPSAKYGDAQARLQFHEENLRRLRALPGVEMVGATSATPLGGHWGQFFAVEGEPEPGPDDVRPVTLNRVVSAGYLETMGVTLLHGRLLDEGDGRNGGTRTVVVNETFARNNFPDGEAVGRRIRYPWEEGEEAWMTVVGVIRNTRHYGPDEDMRQGLFQALPQMPMGYMTMVLRTSLDPTSLVPEIRELTRNMDPDVPVIRPQTMESIVDEALWSRRMVAWLFGAFAGMALILAVAGIYGVLSYTVTQRHLEMGIRMALGAGDGRLVRQVVGQGMVPVALGAMLGVVGAYAMARAVSSIFFDVGVGSPAIYAGVVCLLMVVGGLANLLPARRAARVTPTGALRAGE